MLNDRQKQMLNIIEEQGELSLQQLSETFTGVSVMTLRRDLIQLESSGHILRTRGGAVSLKRLSEHIPIPGEENEYGLRARTNTAAKNEIAKKALPFIKKGCSIYLDAGSTIMALARLLPNDHFNIITNGTNIAQEIVDRTNISVMMPGGTLNRNTLSVSGPGAVSFIKNINIELAFMSASAFTPDSGFTVSNIYEAELKREVIHKAKQKIILMDTGKIGKDLMFTMANLSDIDMLITESSALSAEIKEAAAKEGVRLV